MLIDSTDPRLTDIERHVLAGIAARLSTSTPCPSPVAPRPIRRRAVLPLVTIRSPYMMAART